jgi:FKBP-type peptidyl-prolyl cis-trans isomerase 2
MCPEEKIMAAENGEKVTFHFTLTMDEKVIQTSVGQQPMCYTHGSGQLIPGLAAEIEGMNEGEEKSVMVSAKDAYGDVNPDAFQELPKTSLPDGLIPQNEMMLQIKTPDGQTIPARISEVKEESTVIDMNHPLAGKDLRFDVKVISIE